MTNGWQNWAGDQTCAPAEFVIPEHRDQVAQAIRRAGSAGRVVRVAGAGHSFTDAVLTDGTLLSLERCNRVLDVDTSSGLVRVEAGITLHDLNTALHEHGLALHNLGDIDTQSLAGATATGTHGTGARIRNISAALQSIELTLADGSTIEVNEESDPDAWRAARVSIGALGVVTAMTIQTVPAFVLEQRDTTMPLDEVLAEHDSFVDSNDHYEFFTFPHSPRALTKRHNRTDRPAQPRSAVATWVNNVLFQNTAFGAFIALGRLNPRWIPRINRTLTRLSEATHSFEYSHRILVTPRLIRFNEMEYAIPREYAADAVAQVKKVAEQAEFDVSFPIEVRWVAPDDAFLSPAGGRETCYIAVHVAKGMPFEPYFRAAEAVFDEFGGRPHWGKLHFQTAATLRDRYPDWERFAAVRRRLDPDGRFANDYVKRVLG